MSSPIYRLGLHLCFLHMSSTDRFTAQTPRNATYIRGKDMPNMEPTTMRVQAVPMTVASLMQRPMAEIQNYESEVVPLLQLWTQYKQGFDQILQQVPGNIYAVANFNMPSLEPDWCRQRLNLFDMRIAHRLLGKNWCKMPDEERPRWIAVPERATYLHYNMIWDVPVQHQEDFFLEAPGIWSRVVPSGQFHLQVIGEEAGEALTVRTYSGKTFHPRWTIDNTITSTGVRRKK
jgi:hypothetical protein